MDQPMDRQADSILRDFEYFEGFLTLIKEFLLLNFNPSNIAYFSFPFATFQMLIYRSLVKTFGASFDSKLT